MTEKEVANILLDIGAVELNVAEPFTYTSGMRSPIYCDNRQIISYPEKRKQIAQAFVDMIEEKGLDYDTLGGTATAGIPHAAWVSDLLGSPMVYIRGKAKGHGKKNQIEGRLDEGANVLIVEDLVSTGGSSVDAGLAVREAGGTVMDCVAIFTYQMESAKQKFEEAKIQLHALSNFTALVEAAVEREYVTQEEADKILEWNQDPTGWAAKMGIEQELKG